MKSLKFIPEKLKVRNDKLQNNVHHNGYTFNKKYKVNVTHYIGAKAIDIQSLFVQKN